MCSTIAEQMRDVERVRAIVDRVMFMMHGETLSCNAMALIAMELLARVAEHAREGNREQLLAYLAARVMLLPRLVPCTPQQRQEACAYGI